MLYVTTRNSRDAYTAQRALREDRGPDGGLYLPFREPVFSPSRLRELFHMNANAVIAEILNLLFNAKLSQWDIDFCIGRHPVRLAELSPKIIMAESWHNPQGRFSWMASRLSELIRQQEGEVLSDWAEVGARIAVLFGVFGELVRNGLAALDKPVDICVVSGSFSAPMSAWYARKWGLPIENIIICCNENNTPWELLHHGQFRTDTVAVPTSTPDGDVSLPAGLERLVYGAGGIQETEKYLESCRHGGVYSPSDLVLSRMRKGMYVGVVGTRRAARIIYSIYSSNGYILSPYGALCWGGMLDYRAQTGQRRYAVILAETSPACYAGTVAEALGIPEKELNRYL